MDYAIAALALLRLTLLFVEERGPLDAMLSLREWAGVYHDDNGKPIGYNESSYLAGLLYCAWCFSLMVGIGYSLLWLLPDIARIVSLPFALSAVVILVKERLLNG